MFIQWLTTFASLAAAVWLLVYALNHFPGWLRWQIDYIRWQRGLPCLHI